MKIAEEYFNENYGKGHIERCIELNDIQSIYSLMEEFADDAVNKNTLSHSVSNSALPKLNDFAVGNFDSIAQTAQRITTGNVAHHRNTIVGLANRCSEFIAKYYC